MLNILFNNAFNIEIKNNDKYLKYEQKLNNDFNFKTMTFLKPNYNYIDIINIDFYLSYCFKQIRKWILLNEFYDEKYINTLEKIIKNLNLDSKLGSYEIQYINHCKEVVFAKTRNLKKLIVDFPLEIVYVKKNISKNSSELVCFQFINSSLKEYISNKNVKTITKNCEIYLSNKRIIFNNISNIVSFYFIDIYEYKMENHKLKISVKQNDVIVHYLLETYDSYVLYVAFQRMFNLWTKKTQKKKYFKRNKKHHKI